MLITYSIFQIFPKFLPSRKLSILQIFWLHKVSQRVIRWFQQFKPSWHKTSDFRANQSSIQNLPTKSFDEKRCAYFRKLVVITLPIQFHSLVNSQKLESQEINVVISNYTGRSSGLAQNSGNVLLGVNVL